MIDGSNRERAVWLLPRGIVLLEHIQFIPSDSWAVEAHYFDYCDGWQYGTHFHSSYADHWRSEEAEQTQYRKIGIPRGDWQFASGLIESIISFRLHAGIYDVSGTVEQFRTLGRPIYYFPPAVAIVRQHLQPYDPAIVILGPIRDIISGIDDTLRYRRTSRTELHAFTKSVRRQLKIASVACLSQSSALHYFVDECINKYDEGWSDDRVIEWLSDIKHILYDIHADVT